MSIAQQGKLRRFARSLGTVVRTEGWRAAAAFSVIRMLQFVIGHDRTYVALARFDDRRFDRRYHLDTGGIITLQSLGLGAESRASGNGYVGTSPYAFKRVMSHVPARPGDCTFIDFGCGKGRVLFLAAEVSFRRIVGVEIAAELAAACEANIARYSGGANGTDIQVRCVDATTFDYPETDLVVYFFNPFGASIMRRVIDRLVESLRQTPRKAYVVYVKPVYQEVLDATPALKKIAENTVYPWYAIYEAIPPGNPS